jgi:hypothetical protein
MSTVSPQLMQRIRQDVQSMHAYAIQDSAGMVKLDAMENPHRLPADLQKALGERLGALALNRYPGERVNELRHALASYAGMPEGFDIMLGNGSDELISLPWPAKRSIRHHAGQWLGRIDLFAGHGLRCAWGQHPVPAAWLCHVRDERPVARPGFPWRAAHGRL